MTAPRADTSGFDVLDLGQRALDVGGERHVSLYLAKYSVTTWSVGPAGYSLTAAHP
jgi:hypothetical protein